MAVILTYIQLFGIGFSFNIAGPCFISCAPFLIAYLGAKQLPWKQSLREIFIFLIGRLVAYLMLGYLAGISGAALRQYSNSAFITFLKPLAGIIIIFFGIFIWLGKASGSYLCKVKNNKPLDSGSLFILGFLLGVSPCAPLLALLFEIALITKNAWQGVVYALFFGLGTFLAGFIVFAALSGVFSWLPQRFFKSTTAQFIFRSICALLLIFLGLKFILAGLK